MKRFKPDTLFKYLVLIFSVAYVFVTFTDMLCIPRYAASSSKINGVACQGFKTAKCTGVRSINFLQLIDRSAIDKEPWFVSSLTPKGFSLIFSRTGLNEINRTTAYRVSGGIPGRRYSYLSFCTFRI